MAPSHPVTSPPYTDLPIVGWFGTCIRKLYVLHGAAQAITEGPTRPNGLRLYNVAENAWQTVSAERVRAAFNRVRSGDPRFADSAREALLAYCRHAGIDSRSTAVRSWLSSETAEPKAAPAPSSLEFMERRHATARERHADYLVRHGQPPAMDGDYTMPGERAYGERERDTTRCHGCPIRLEEGVDLRHLRCGALVCPACGACLCATSWEREP